MPLILPAKRTHAQTSSDVEDNSDYHVASTSTAAASSSPASTHASLNSDACTPEGRPTKMAKYSFSSSLPAKGPKESPTNVFRVGNDLYYRSLLKQTETKTLPQDSKALLKLRFQLKGTKVYRVARVPSTYTFAHMHDLILFLFGWSTNAASSSHRWSLVKEVVRSKNGTEIAKSRSWMTLAPKGKAADIEDECDWTIGRLWGAGGVFTERGALYNHDDSGSSIHLTLVSAEKVVRATNLPLVMEGRGAPALKRPVGSGAEVAPDAKRFMIRSFQGNAFEQWFANDGVETTLSASEVRVCRPRDAGGLWAPIPLGRKHQAIKSLPIKKIVEEDDDTELEDEEEEEKENDVFGGDDADGELEHDEGEPEEVDELEEEEQEEEEEED